MHLLVWLAIVACIHGAPVNLPRLPLGLILEGNSRVIGGVLTEPNEFPFVVSIQRRSFSWSHMCGGTIYNENWIITNAHCYEGVTTLNSLRIDAGEYSFALPSGHEQLRSVEEYILHPDYNSTTLVNDIALIRLSEPLDFADGTVAPVAIPKQEEEFPDGTKVTVAGWGLLASDGLKQDKQHKAEVEVVNDTACDVAYLSGGYINPSMVCAGVPEGGLGPCQGDYGGPLFTTTKPHVLVGIVSWGYPGCAAPGFPDVYTQVSYFVDWILSVVSP